MKRTTFTFAAGFWMLAALWFPGSILAAGGNEEPVVEEDITFREVDDMELKLDIARPARGRRRSPALVYVFGGLGWQSGSRGQFKQEIERAAEHGYVAVAVDYRLTGGECPLTGGAGTVEGRYPFPAQLHDVKCAVRWLRENADSYRIDPDRIGVIGWGCGGQLALMAALTDPEDGFEGPVPDDCESSRVQAAVGLEPPTEMASFYEDLVGYTADKEVWFRGYLGGTPEEVPARYVEASPVSYVSPDDPPVALFYGESDRTKNQGEILQERMTNAGGECDLNIIPGLRHGQLSIPSPTWSAALWDFLDSHLM